MASSLSELNPRPLWKHFAKILTIPHCSGNEKALGDYVLGVAASPWACPASATRSATSSSASRRRPDGRPPSASSSRAIWTWSARRTRTRSTTSPRTRSRPRSRANGSTPRGRPSARTTASAWPSALAVMEDRSLVHGPLEFLFTVDEETGLTGANKIQKGFLAGKMLLNLDSEDEGIFTIGCAGGADSKLVLPFERKKTASKNLYRLHVRGFRGGHSGLDINQGRGNAIKLLARVLAQAQASREVRGRSASKAAASTTPSRARRWPSWPARPSRYGR